MAQIDPELDALIGDWLSLHEAAQHLTITVTKVRQLLRDHKLLGVNRPGGDYAIPTAFVGNGHLIKGLHGTLTLLFDCGFGEAEALRWLFTADETLPGTPIQAIADHRGTEVNRRAQALAL